MGVREGERLAAPMEMVRIRFPAETLAWLRVLGPGWRGMVVRAVEKELGRGGGGGHM